MAQEAPLVVVPLPELDETPEDGEMPEDEELLDDELELEDEDDPDEDLADDDLLDDEPAEGDLTDLDDLPDEVPDDDPEVVFFAVEEWVPVLVCAAVAAEAWVVCAPTTAAVAVAAVAASAVVQVIFLTRLRPAVLAWTACRKWELVMATGKPASF
jgi:hypothetical protein